RWSRSQHPTTRRPARPDRSKSTKSRAQAKSCGTSRSAATCARCIAQHRSPELGAGDGGSYMNVLVTHSYYLYYDPKQVQRMRPYPPLATLISAALLRAEGHAVRFFDAMLAPGVEAFEQCLREVRPAMVAILEDNFNFLTKM